MTPELRYEKLIGLVQMIELTQMMKLAQMVLAQQVLGIGLLVVELGWMME